MSRKAKTPPALARVIMERHAAVIDHLDEMLHIKRTLPVDQQAPHIRDRTEAEMVAYVDGFNACLEAAMHEFNCYAGFSYAGPVRIDPVHGHQSRDLFNNSEAREAQEYYQTGIEKAPRFAGWRRVYYTNGIAKS